MTMPASVGTIDLMVGLPARDGEVRGSAHRIAPLLLDRDSRERFSMPAQYLFTDRPETAGDDPIGRVVAEMDRYGIERALTTYDEDRPEVCEALERFPGRFLLSYEADPGCGMDEVRKIERLHRDVGLSAVSGFPAGRCPQVPIDHAHWYPIYAKCVELDLPFICNAGVPGPRVPMAAQSVDRVDEVCWFFPELRFVMRHGAEPWTALAVKLMLKWPNLYYMTSAFAPKHYPEDIVAYANTRGAEKILYAGYFPMGLSLERIFRDLEKVPFREHVWPLFLRENAVRVFKLGAPQ
jgi:predicted TIM-barrel fold metal-dependent hydrolase